LRVIKNAANNDPAATLDSHLDCRALLIQIVALQMLQKASKCARLAGRPIGADKNLHWRYQTALGGQRFLARARMWIDMVVLLRFALKAKKT
jgi:hypothetical protein